MVAEANYTTIVFDVSKNPPFGPSDGYRRWARKLKTLGFRVIVNKDEITPDILGSETILVIPGPRGRYSELEFNHLRRFVSSGGSVLTLLSEGGEKMGTNVNFWLEELGISANQDCVLRTSYYKYFHPKEALIIQGVLNRTINTLADELRVDGKERENGASEMNGDHMPSVARVTEKTDRHNQQVTYVYPFGATLNVTAPSIALMSSGPVCLPTQRPTVALYVDSKSNGRLLVIGSVHVFHDSYIVKEDNSLLNELFMKILSSAQVPTFNKIDAKNPEVNDYIAIPDLEHLAEQPFACLQEGESVPMDFTKLFSKNLFSLDNCILASIYRAYEEMQMTREPLKLIKPKFETPLPPLVPSVFPPNLRLPQKPKLELFDLDDEFSSTHTRLLQAANKYLDDDLEMYVKECGLVLNVDRAASRPAKAILYDIVSRIVEYKKVNADQ